MCHRFDATLLSCTDPCCQQLVEKLDRIEQQQQELSSILLNPSKGSFCNPASSCEDILQDSPSGEYWILNDGRPNKIYCEGILFALHNHR